MSIKNKTMNIIISCTKLVVLGIVIVITDAMLITFNGFKQSVDAQKSQDMYRLGIIVDA
jgi:hypothetical protein